ncbi:MAG: PQQ-dependent sugar dehydrogenase, partial [Xanthomonadales bacterium]|nr:PQQ-dependent sugar dehydrogenase [Xanthomonadales bacterium]
IGVSGLALYRGDAFPHWRGSLLAGGLSGERLELLDLDGQSVVRVETVVQGIGRIRDVRVGPAGLVYLAIDNRDGDTSPILRLEPVARGPVRR